MDKRALVNYIGCMECKKKSCVHLRGMLEQTERLAEYQIEAYKADLEAARVHIKWLEKRIEQIERRCAHAGRK